MWPFESIKVPDPLRPKPFNPAAVADALGNAAVSGRTANDDAKSVTSPAALQNLVSRGYKLKQKITGLTRELDGINARLIEALGDGEKLDVGVIRAQCIARTQVRITTPDDLRKVLGAYRYADLVKERVIATPTDRLRELADEQPEIAAQIEEKTDRHIKYTLLDPAGS